MDLPQHNKNKKRSNKLPKSDSVLSLLQKNLSLSLAYVVIIFLYTLFSYTTPINKATLTKYHLSIGSYNAVLLIIIIPYIVIWLIALIGFLKFKDYTKLIKSSKDGAAFHDITLGILWLTLWLPISALVSSVSSYLYTKHPSTKPTMVILSNYINLTILLPLFTYIYSGSKKLLKVIDYKPDVNVLFSSLYITFASLYVLLTLHDQSRYHAAKGITIATYYLPDWLIILSIVIPRLIMWSVGFLAVYNVYCYRRRVNGKIYQDSLKDLARGLIGTISAIITLRCFQSLSSFINKQSLSILLFIIYLLLILLAVGYIYIYKGANSLLKIEKV